MPALKSETSPLEMARSLESFLLDHPRSVLIGDGQMLFDMSAAKYALSAEHGRCVLHLWSEERNLIRTVVGLEERKDKLCIRVRRLGAQRLQSLHLVPAGTRRAPVSREAARNRYLRLLERMFLRFFADFRTEGLRSSVDLENSFGPGYVRGLLVRGQGSWAVIGAGAAETQATIDGVLTVGILWLAYCRQHARKSVVQGLKIVVPSGSSAATRARMAWLNSGLGRWELYELDEGSEELTQIDISGEGNLEMRLVHAFDSAAALERARPDLDRIFHLLPAGIENRVKVQAKSPHEVTLSLHGLEFARVRQGFVPDSFARRGNISFGAGANETALTPETEAWLVELAERLFARRFPSGSARDPLFRMRPEAWLEATLCECLEEVEPSLQACAVYSQVPAFAASDRAVLDLLTATKSGRLAVLEIKAEEDMHLPLQGVDYWLRVHRLNEQRNGEGRGELERYGYFPGRPLAHEVPLLYYIVPALHLHPSMETVLAHLSPAIPWMVIALNEGWRTEPKVVFRKRSPNFPS